jgi:sortase (surface protein transpeptidase)
VSTNVGELGLQPDHEVMVPTSTHTVGWFKDGPTPGQVGSAVILGHVDSYLGPGTLFDLKLLKPGDRVDLVLADGTITRFAVTKVVQYSKTDFPDRLVYGSHGTRSLQLVTCGGTFDHVTGSYESNVVVFSHLVSVSLPKGVVRS